MTFFERITDVTEKMTDLLKKKNSDYGNAFCENLDDFGVGYGIGRLCEKTSRARQLAKKGRGEVSDESLRDTIADTMGYCAILLAWMDGKKDSADGVMK